MALDEAIVEDDADFCFGLIAHAAAQQRHHIWIAEHSEREVER